MEAPVERLEVAVGSVIGRHHALSGRNRQDAFAVSRTPGGLAVVVADGCSAGDRSEVGAELGVRLLSGALSRRVGLALDPQVLAREAGDEVVAGLAAVLDRLAPGETRARMVGDLCLFTMLAIVVDLDRTIVLGLGDGWFSVDGRATELGPFPGNRPPYLGYALLGDAPGLSVLAECSTDRLEHLAVGTDGSLPLLETGDAAWLWEDDRVFSNPDGLRRRLALRNRPPAPRFSDDATVAVVRRKEVRR